MNDLQKFLEEQKAFYTKRLTSGAIIRIRDIKAMIKAMKPIDYVSQQIIRYASHTADLYCRLLLANIEGEIIRLVKDAREHEKERSSLFDHWQLPDPNLYGPGLRVGTPGKKDPDPEQAAAAVISGKVKDHD